MSHFNMGAINIANDQHEIPCFASKECKYKCPTCERKVKFCKGKIKAPYFSHYKSDHPCTFYVKPSESEMHKEAKRIMKTLLDRNIPIIVSRNCICCSNKYFRSKITVNPAFCALIEHPFTYKNSNKRADVALVDKITNNIVAIFEIFHTHATSSLNRPEPWFEIKAQSLCEYTNILNSSSINIQCVRDWTCNECNIKRQYLKRKQQEYRVKKQQREMEETRIRKEREGEREMEETRIRKEREGERERLRLSRMEEQEMILMFENDQLSQDKLIEEQHHQQQRYKEEYRKRIEKENILEKYRIKMEELRMRRKK